MLQESRIYREAPTKAERRIIYVIRPVAGGMREHLTLLVKHLDREAFEPVAIVPVDDLLAKRLRELGVEPAVVPEVGSLNPTAVLRAARKIAKIAAGKSQAGHTQVDAQGRRAVKAAVIHSHGYRAALAGGVAARLAGLPHITTIHTELGGRADSGAKGRLAQRIVALLSDRVIVVSEALEGRFGAKTRVVANGVELGVRKSPLRAASDRRLVGVIARLSPEKGVDIFLDAAARLAEDRDDIDFLIVGEGPLRTELEERSAALGISSRTSFTGFVEGVREVLGSLDLLVLPSRSEGQPMILLEALATGCPVVATDVGGVGSLLEGDCGLLVGPENPEALANAVAGLLDDPEEAGRMAERGLRKVSESYSVGRMAGETMAVYSEVLS